MANEPVFIKNQLYNFWTQMNPQPFEYDITYKSKQSTTDNMCWLRLGLLTSVISPKDVKNMVACDIGSGNGTFVNNFNHLFKQLYGYDLAGESITQQQLMCTTWDIIFMTDVLQHYTDIQQLYDIKWKYLYISFPQTPTVNTQQQLSKWKHYKPNEHIWCLNKNGMIKWFEDHKCEVLMSANTQDMIRTPVNDVNITTMIVKRDN